MLMEGGKPIREFIGPSISLYLQLLSNVMTPEYPSGIVLVPSGHISSRLPGVLSTYA